MRRIPVTLTLIVAILLVFFYQLRVAAMTHEGPAWSALMATSDEDVLQESGAAFVGMNLRTDWWRLIASIFLHAGVIHLAFNLLALFSIGRLLETLFGPAVMSLSFAFGGVVSGLAILIQPHSASEPLLFVGASGAIFSLAGTLLVAARRVWHIERALWSRSLSSRLVGCLAFNLGLGLVVSAIATWTGMSFVIANTAHVAGLVAGVLVGWLPLRLRQDDVANNLIRLFEPPPP